VIGIIVSQPKARQSPLFGGRRGPETLLFREAVSKREYNGTLTVGNGYHETTKV
jgi:hypothetical protein